MTALFYTASGVAVAATVLALTRRNIFHGLIYLVLSLLAVSLVFFSLMAPLVAALEVIVYAGAIMVLFVFVVMMLNLGERTTREEQGWLPGRVWRGPGILAAVLLFELINTLCRTPFSAAAAGSGAALGPREVALSLFGPYVIAVELASLLLLAGLVGAFHLGTQARSERGGNTP